MPLSMHTDKLFAVCSYRISVGFRHFMRARYVLVSCLFPFDDFLAGGCRQVGLEDSSHHELQRTSRFLPAVYGFFLTCLLVGWVTLVREITFWRKDCERIGKNLSVFNRS